MPAQGSPRVPEGRSGRDHSPVMNFTFGFTGNIGFGIGGEGVRGGGSLEAKWGITGGKHMLPDKFSSASQTHEGGSMSRSSGLITASVMVPGPHLLSGDDVASFSLLNSQPIWF